MRCFFWLIDDRPIRARLRSRTPLHRPLLALTDAAVSNAAHAHFICYATFQRDILIIGQARTCAADALDTFQRLLPQHFVTLPLNE
jgi:hypothetical protein